MGTVVQIQKTKAWKKAQRPEVPTTPVVCCFCRSIYGASQAEIKVCAMNARPMFVCKECRDAVPVAR